MTDWTKKRSTSTKSVAPFRYLLTSICVTFTGTIAVADEVKVYVNHAPAGFFETLDKIDTENQIVLARDRWFEPAEADVWVMFLQPETDLFTVPDLAQKVYREISDVAGDIARVNVTLVGRDNLRIQIVDLSKPSAHGIDYRGCVSAVDIAFIAYPATLPLTDEKDEICSGYKAR